MPTIDASTTRISYSHHNMHFSAPKNPSFQPIRGTPVLSSSFILSLLHTSVTISLSSQHIATSSSFRPTSSPSLSVNPNPKLYVCLPSPHLLCSLFSEFHFMPFCLCFVIYPFLRFTFRNVSPSRRPLPIVYIFSLSFLYPFYIFSISYLPTYYLLSTSLPTVPNHFNLESYKHFSITHKYSIF
jgi:4-amino-4-deoxy-L-arabinose transferase-like glycosyltransferase